MIYILNPYKNFSHMLTKIKTNIYSLGLLVGRFSFNNRNSKVLYYHDVHKDNDLPETRMSTPMSLFLEHIRIIKKLGFEIVDQITRPNDQVMITFDDGYLGVYKNKE